MVIYTHKKPQNQDQKCHPTSRVWFLFRCTIRRCPRFGTAKLVVMITPISLWLVDISWYISTWWFIPGIVSRLVHPSCKWINRTYPIYNQGYSLLTIRGMNHQVLSGSYKPTHTWSGTAINWAVTLFLDFSRSTNSPQYLYSWCDG